MMKGKKIERIVERMETDSDLLLLLLLLLLQEREGSTKDGGRGVC